MAGVNEYGEAPHRSPLGLFPGWASPRLYDSVVETLRARHYSRRTEQAYLHWIRRFVVFQGREHPRQLGEPEVNRFLTHLAVKENVAASTQNQALAALLFLYEHVLERPLNRIEGVVRAGGADSQVPEREPGMGLAVGVPGFVPLSGSADGPAASPPPA